MKMAVSSTGPDLDALVDARFGRCQYFVFVDSETMKFEAVPNSNLAAMHGAGIQTAQMVASKGVKVVLTGNCGPNAFQTLSAAGIQVIVGISGKVRDAIEKYRKGELQPTFGASVSRHFGTGGMSPGSGNFPGSGIFPGMGGPRGIRPGGAGRGMGRGMMGDIFQTGPYESGNAPGAPFPMTGDEELESLKKQAQAITRQLDEINNRIREIEKGK